MLLQVLGGGGVRLRGEALWLGVACVEPSSGGVEWRVGTHEGAEGKALRGV